jgi:hypothetical protein
MKAIDGAKAAEQQPGPASPASEAKAETKLQPAKRGALKLFELSNNVHGPYIAPPGVTAEQIAADPNYWDMCAGDLRSGDEIKVQAHDRSWSARFEVHDAQPGYVSASLAYSKRAPLVRAVDAAKQLPKGWNIVRTAPGDECGDGFVAVNSANGKRIMSSGGVAFETYELARRGLLDHAIFAEDKATKYLP